MDQQVEPLKTCWSCKKPCVEPRPFGPPATATEWTCGCCRSLDRIRGLVVQLPASSSVAVLHRLRNLESDLVDWLGFGGIPPSNEAPPPTFAPEPSLNSLLRPSVKARPGNPPNPVPSRASYTESRAPLPRRHNVGTAGPKPPPVPPPSAAAASSSSRGGGRKKKNKGLKRKAWQAARQDLAEWRARGAAEPQPVESSEDSDLE